MASKSRPFRSINLATFAAAALAGALPAVAAGGAGEGAQGARARVELKIVIPNVLRLRVLRAPSHVDVTDEDVQRGFVALSGFEIEIDANVRAGYNVLATMAGGPFTAAVVEGLPVRLHVGQGGSSAWIPYSVNHRRQMRLSYRLELQPGMVPGRYAAPVSLALSAS